METTSGRFTLTRSHGVDLDIPDAVLTLVASLIYSHCCLFFLYVALYTHDNACYACFLLS